MHTLTLLIKTTKYDEQQINRRFHAYQRIYNTAVKRVRKLITRLERDEDYKQYLAEYKLLLQKQKLNTLEKQRKLQLSKELSSIRTGSGLSKANLYAYLKLIGKKHKNLLSSQQVQSIANRVWISVEKYLFGDGKRIGFKKFTNVNTIGGTSNLNGVRFNKETMSATWLGLMLSPKLPNDISYINESLDNKISYCEVKRMMFNNGYHYYLVIYLDGKAPKKLTNLNNDSKCGIDPGVSTVAAVSDKQLFLTELAPKSKKYNKQISKLQGKLDRSLRATNPSKYNADGTINKHNKSKWIKSKTYKKLQRQLHTLYRKKSAYIKQSHERLCNDLIKTSNSFIVEHMSFIGLAKKAKETKRQEKPSVINNKTVFKYKKKRRFGTSINNRAPALFLLRLQQKCNLYGLHYQEIDTIRFKASQYNHLSDDYIKVPLKQRSKLIGTDTVQRDLYSAFLIKNADLVTMKPDRNLCLNDFAMFVKLQNELIETMMNNNISMKQCFGF